MNAIEIALILSAFEKRLRAGLDKHTVQTNPDVEQKNKLIRRWGSERELPYDDIVHALQNTIDSCINSATDRRGYLLEHTQVYQIQWNNAM